jgi:hypothetical protein
MDASALSGNMMVVVKEQFSLSLLGPHAMDAINQHRPPTCFPSAISSRRISHLDLNDDEDIARRRL